MDFANRAIAKARQKTSTAQLQAEYHIGDVTQIKFPLQTFDLILDMGCFHGLPPGGRTDYARAVQSWLKSNGTYLLYAVLDPTGDSNMGISDNDLGMFKPLTLTHRENGINPGPMAKPSAWFTFTKR